MANEQNLRPFTSDQNREEAAKNGRKGGVASGKARRDKKLIHDCLLYLVQQNHVDKKGKKHTGAELVSSALFKKAVSGDLKAIEMVIELCEPNVSNSETEDLDAIEADLFGKGGDGE